MDFDGFKLMMLKTRCIQERVYMHNQYSISEFITNVFAWIGTKLFYPKARLIRRPIYVRGRKSMIYDEGLTVGHACRFDLPGDTKTLFIGKNCEIGDYVHIVAHNKVEIGDNVLLASKIFISDTSHGIYKGEKQSSPYVLPNDRPLATQAVQIGNRVWIGENVIVLPGSCIGNGAIIGANSIVNCRIPDNCIAVGTPAKVIKIWNEIQNKWEKI